MLGCGGKWEVSSYLPHPPTHFRTLPLHLFLPTPALFHTSPHLPTSPPHCVTKVLATIVSRSILPDIVHSAILIVWILMTVFERQ